MVKEKQRKDKEMRKRWLVLWAVVMMFWLSGFVANGSENYPVCRVDWLSEDSASLELKWKHADSRPLMITGWKMAEDGSLLVFYQAGGDKVFADRVISVDKPSFPCKIKLLPSGQPAQDKKLFRDMPAGKEQVEAISNLYYQGILSGYPDGSFAPTKHVTRAEFSKILWEALRLNRVQLSGDNPFRDIEKNWAKPYILDLYRKKLVNGKSTDRFDPNGKVTLGEVLALLDRSFYLYQKQDRKFNLPQHWSNPAYQAMVSHKVVKESDDIYTRYTPNRPAARAEIALFLSRVLQQKHDVK